MPRREGEVLRMEEIPAGERVAADAEFQRHWYAHLVERYRDLGVTILDAGAGTGYGLRSLTAAGILAVGFDVVDLGVGVPVNTIESYGDNSFDVVLAIDVIEHVDDDVGFLGHLLRVARSEVFVSTPNWLVSRAVNPYHVREYTPLELQGLIASFGFARPWIDHEIWVSNHILEITTRNTFDPDETWHNQAVLLRKTCRQS